MVNDDRLLLINNGGNIQRFHKTGILADISHERRSAAILFGIIIIWFSELQAICQTQENFVIVAV